VDGVRRKEVALKVERLGSRTQGALEHSPLERVHRGRRNPLGDSSELG
jgi:hypothetical protein